MSFVNSYSLFDRMAKSGRLNADQSQPILTGIMEGAFGFDDLAYLGSLSDEGAVALVRSCFNRTDELYIRSIKAQCRPTVDQALASILTHKSILCWNMFVDSIAASDSVVLRGMGVLDIAEFITFGIRNGHIPWENIEYICGKSYDTMRRILSGMGEMTNEDTRIDDVVTLVMSPDFPDMF